MMGESLQYGDRRGLLLQLELFYADGTMETVISDGGMQWNDSGCIRYSDLFIGEMQDKLHFASQPQEVSADERWEAVVAAAIGAIVTGLSAFVLFKLGLKP